MAVLRNGKTACCGRPQPSMQHGVALMQVAAALLSYSPLRSDNGKGLALPICNPTGSSCSPVWVSIIPCIEL